MLCEKQRTLGPCVWDKIQALCCKKREGVQTLHGTFLSGKGHVQMYGQGQVWRQVWVECSVARDPTSTSMVSLYSPNLSPSISIGFSMDFSS